MLSYADIYKYIYVCISIFVSEARNSLEIPMPIEQLLSFPECIWYNIPNHQGRGSEADVLPRNHSGISQSSSCLVRYLKDYDKDQVALALLYSRKRGD